jgi:hypothetical protein
VASELAEGAVELLQRAGSVLTFSGYVLQRPGLDPVSLELNWASTVFPSLYQLGTCTQYPHPQSQYPTTCPTVPAAPTLFPHLIGPRPAPGKWSSGGGLGYWEVGQHNAKYKAQNGARSVKFGEVLKTASSSVSFTGPIRANCSVTAWTAAGYGHAQETLSFAKTHIDSYVLLCGLYVRPPPTASRPVRHYVCCLPSRLQQHKDQL